MNNERRTYVLFREIISKEILLKEIIMLYRHLKRQQQKIWTSTSKQKLKNVDFIIFDVGKKI